MKEEPNFTIARTGSTVAVTDSGDVRGPRNSMRLFGAGLTG